MNRNSWMWKTIASVALLFTALWIAGFVYAVKTVVAPSGTLPAAADKSAEAPFAEDGSVELVALGDSLTFGYGDSTGAGYVGRLREQLEARTEKPVRVVGNFAVSGYTTAQVLADLREREGIAAALKRADAVLLTAGGNDLLRLGDEIDVEAFEANVPEALANIRDILATIRDVAPEAHIYYIGLYNPFIEYVEIEGTSLAVQTWNDAVFRELEPFANVTFVPTFDVFQHATGRLLASDGYHPNDEGYARIAERLAMLME